MPASVSNLTRITPSAAAVPLADWKAGKIPICVVDRQGKVTIEGQIDPIIVRSSTPAPSPAGIIG
ncbi:MAG: hypothetical protein HC898_03580 [Phycisphaerales bacterium]|nr:hypothetical protein [Phycisphaerales bacterium]